MCPVSVEYAVKAMLNEYLKSHEIKKIQIGAGDHKLPGWFNVDMFPTDPEVFKLDASKAFPIPDSTFDYVFSEHMIEHISWIEGYSMIKECFRILKPNGRIRITTPSLDFLVKLHTCPSDLEKDYMFWASSEFINDAPFINSVFVINNFMRAWGHQFIYDKNILAYTLESAGFAEIIEYEICKSFDENLVNLENPKRMPPGFLQLESMTMEGIKPRKLKLSLWASPEKSSSKGDVNIK